MSPVVDPTEGTVGASRLPRRLEVLRSLIFSPGQRQKMVDKAPDLAADGVIFDLEDGVPPQEKAAARQIVAAALSRPSAADEPARLVRVNARASGFYEDDLAAILRPGLDAVLLPKVEGPDEVLNLESALSAGELSAGIIAGTIRVVVALESALGVHRGVDILSASERVVAVMFGAEDFALDLGLPVARVGHGHELLHARSAVVAAAVIGRVAALDQVWLDYRDLDGLRSDAVAGRQLGFAGKCLIHPSQIDIVNEVFSPSAEDVELAERVVAAFNEAFAAGIGAVMLGGQLVELPIVERAQRTLRLSAKLRPEKPDAGAS